MDLYEDYLQLQLQLSSPSDCIAVLKTVATMHRVTDACFHWFLSCPTRNTIRNIARDFYYNRGEDYAKILAILHRAWQVDRQMYCFCSDLYYGWLQYRLALPNERKKDTEKRFQRNFYYKKSICSLCWIYSFCTWLGSYLIDVWINNNLFHYIKNVKFLM